MSARSRLPALAVTVVLVAVALWWRAAQQVIERPEPAAPPPPTVAAATPDASPPDADVPPDSFDLRGEVVDLPAGVKFIVPPRLRHEWVEGKRTLAFGEGDQLLAIVNVTTGKKLEGLVAPRVGVKLLAKEEKLEVTSIEEYAPGRLHAQLDGEQHGMQVQQHLIFISLPSARVTIYVQLSGAVILDPRRGDLLQELRTNRVVL